MAHGVCKLRLHVHEMQVNSGAVVKPHYIICKLTPYSFNTTCSLLPELNRLCQLASFIAPRLSTN